MCSRGLIPKTSKLAKELSQADYDPLMTTTTTVMPNIRWLKPGQGRKSRVLFITYLGGIHEVA